MPPRPFPWPLAVGTDICAISRIRAVLSNAGWRQRAKDLRQHSHGSQAQRSKLRQFLKTLMTYDEMLHFIRRFPFVLAVDNTNPRSPAEVDHEELSSKWHLIDSHLAGRFAAKEAISKAYGGQVSRHQITILRSMPEFQPLAVVHAKPRIISPQQRLYLCRQFGFEFVDLGTDASLENFDPAPAQVEDLEGQVVKLSISHDGDYATATCIAPTGPLT